jgi:hypothetical protein
MKESTRIAPPNSLILVMDRSVGDIPQTMGGKSIASTPTCVAIGTLSASDGQTLISLSDELLNIPTEEASFDAILDTPKKRVAVCSVQNKTLLQCEVLSLNTRVRVWTNHPSEPDTVQIVVQPVTR